MTRNLKDHGYRLTPQRLAILKVLAHTDRHLSVEEIHQQLHPDYPTMSLATVYKTLAVLKREGAVLELEFHDLRNRYDSAKPYPHPHVICTACGMVMDPEDYDLRELTNRIARETGFAITSHRLDFYGLCPACRKASGG
ncbi:MAG: Fur family transcriptional regulator [Desulfovibrionaceae bacterium]